MLVCPECGHTQREGTGVCLSCETRFVAGTDEVTEPRREVRPVGSPRRAVGLLITAILAATFFLGRPYFMPAAENPAQAALENLTTQVASNLDDTGTLPPDIQATFEEAAVRQSDCGVVKTYLIPGDAIPPPVPGQPGPESVITTYLQTEVRAEVVAVTRALGGTMYVAAAAWGCP